MAMSCGRPALQEGPIMWPSPVSTCSVRWKSKQVCMKWVISLTSSAWTSTWSMRGGAIPIRPLRHRPRVEERQPATDLLDVVHDLHLVAGRRLEADRLALPDLLALADPPHAEPVALDGGLELVEVVLELGLEREAVDADPRVVADRHAVVIALVPALEEQALLGALDDVEPEHLGVVGGGELEIGALMSTCDSRRMPMPHRTEGVPHPGKLSRCGTGNYRRGP